MKNGFDKEQDLLQPPDIFHNQDPRMSPRQAEIYRNLEAIGPEISAFYLSGVKVLQNKDIETSSYLLAHIAREIEGGLRDVLSRDQEKRQIQGQLKKADLGHFSERRGHIASILAALGIDDLGDPLAKRWISVAIQFHKFAHRHGAWEAPRAKEVFVPLWHEFEEVLMDLVGNHFNFLNRVDRLLDYEKPTKEIIKTLPYLLASEVRYAYFFNKLDSPVWLKDLRDTGWFDPKNRSTRPDGPDQSEYYRSSVWHALKYVEKVATHTQESPCEETVNILADIVNTIVDYINDIGESIASDHTDWRVIQILCALPIERIEPRHITFIGVALKSRVGATLVHSAIGETVLPKLLDGGAKELTLVLLEDMLDAKVIHGNIRTVMDEYWLWDSLQKNEQVIEKLCGIETVRIAYNRIRTLINDGAYSFNVISKIDNALSDYPHRRYAELLVGFIAGLLRSIKFDNSIEKIVKKLLQEGLAVNCDEPLKRKARSIFGRIALNAITHRYEDLKHLFWDWQGNPLNETFLKPEIYQLLQANCLVFDEGEIDRVLHWIESQQDMEVTEGDDIRTKQVAYRKREWLSALLETGNAEILSAYQKYEQINPAKLENPGSLFNVEIWSGRSSPLTVEELSALSNTQIAEYLVEFKEQEVIVRRTDPTEEGLARTLKECVGTNPQRFTDDLQSFQEVKNFYQHSLLYGFLDAWRDKKDFDWAALLDFIHQLVSSERFWDEQYETGLNYRDWVLSVVADLVTAGTKNDKYAFDVQLLPLAEEILLILVGGNVESEGVVTAGHTVDLPLTFLEFSQG